MHVAGGATELGTIESSGHGDAITSSILGDTDPHPSQLSHVPHLPDLHLPRTSRRLGGRRRSKESTMHGLLREERAHPI